MSLSMNLSIKVYIPMKQTKYKDNELRYYESKCSKSSPFYKKTLNLSPRDIPILPTITPLKKNFVIAVHIGRKANLIIDG